MSITVPSSPADRQKLKLALEQITDAMTRQDAEKEHIKEVIAMVKEKFEIDPKYTRKLAKTMYDRSFADLTAENEAFEELYEVIVEGMAASQGPAAPVADEDDSE